MIKTGDIIFVKGKSPFSWLVRYFDKGNFSHVAIAISDTHIIEAQYYKKVEILPYKYGEHEVEIIDLGLNDEQKRKMLSVALKLTGTWYDYPQLFWYVLKKWFGVHGDNRFNNPNNMICSELVSHILIATGYISVEEKVNDLAPNELYNFIKNLCETRGNCQDVKL